MDVKTLVDEHQQENSKNAAGHQFVYLPSLTALRGIAALWVVLFHIDVAIYYRGLGTLIPRESSGLITQGYLWVDFFFILSGFIITHVYGNRFSDRFHISELVDYIRARFWRIYPLHLFTLLVLIGFSVAAPIIEPMVVDDSWRIYFDLQALVSNIFLTNAMNQHIYLSWNIVSWSIGAEWWSYFLGVGTLYFLGKSSLLKIAGMLVTLLILVVFLEYLHSGNGLDITYDYGFIRCLLEFSIGVCGYKLYERGFLQKTLETDLCFVLNILLLLCVFHWQFSDLFSIPLFALVVVSAAYNTSLVGLLLGKEPIQYLRKISYSVYLVHGVWFMFFWSFLPVYQKYYSINSFSLIEIITCTFLFLSLTLATSILTYKYVEHPLRRGVKRERIIHPVYKRNIS